MNDSLKEHLRAQVKDAASPTALVLYAAVLAVAVIILMLAACGHPSPPAATVKTCTAEIVAHPHESTWGPGCKGLTRDQHWQATIQAMQQGARG